MSYISGAKVGESEGAVSYISGVIVDGSKVSVSGVSEAKVGVKAKSVASLSCPKMSVGVQKFEYGRDENLLNNAGNWSERQANSERGRVLEVAQNVANLDGLAKF